MSLRNKLGLRALVVALAIVATVAVWVAATPDADAALGVWAYYSNATYTTVVGARGTGCCGAVINWGITTPFKKFHPIYCTQQICPN